MTDDDELVATISDFLDGGLAGARRDEVARQIAADPTWKRVHDEIVESRKFAGDHLSGMQKARAPETLASDVASTIHSRSAGRFFARRTLGDRVPFGALVIVAVIALAAIGYVMWSSQTGSLEIRHDRGSSTAPGSASLVPRP